MIEEAVGFINILCANVNPFDLLAITFKSITLIHPFISKWLKITTSMSTIYGQSSDLSTE